MYLNHGVKTALVGAGILLLIFFWVPVRHSGAASDVEPSLISATRDPPGHRHLCTDRIAVSSLLSPFLNNHLGISVLRLALVVGSRSQPPPRWPHRATRASTNVAAMSTSMTPIAAVVTSFNPPANLLDALAATLPQVELLVLVNDSPDADDTVLQQAKELGAIIVEHPENLGVAAALNTGIAAVRERLPETAAVVTCDQDSRLPPGYVVALSAAWQAAVEARVPVGMIAPHAAGNIRRLPGIRHVRGVTIGGEPIQSGLMIPTTTLDTLAGFDEALFIDGVDSDFYLRALDAGLVSVVAPVAIAHQLGRTVQARLGPIRRMVTVAADYRYYYRVRNLFVVGRRNFRKHPRWVIHAFIKELRHQLITGLLVSGRRRRLAFTVRGIRDGLGAKTGRLAA